MDDFERRLNVALFEAAEWTSSAGKSRWQAPAVDEKNAVRDLEAYDKLKEDLELLLRAERTRNREAVLAAVARIPEEYRKKFGNKYLSLIRAYKQRLLDSQSLIIRTLRRNADIFPQLHGEYAKRGFAV